MDVGERTTQKEKVVNAKFAAEVEQKGVDLIRDYSSFYCQEGAMKRLQ